VTRTWVEEQLCGRSLLNERLGYGHAEREAGIDDVGRQVFICLRTAPDDLRKTDLLGVGSALLEVAERVAVIEVGRMDGVAGCPQIVGKLQEPRRLPLRV
jgi:hypothetical protein